MPFRYLVDAPRELDVTVGDAAFRVRREREREVTPANVHVRVMVQLLGDDGDLVDDPDPGREVRRRDRSTERSGVALPAGEGSQRRGDGVRGQERGRVFSGS
jgi:hypothetical protein